MTIEEQEALRKFWESNEEIIKSRIKNGRFYTPDIRSYQQLLKANIELFIDLTEEIALKNPNGDWKTFNGESVHINNTDAILDSFIKPGNMSIHDLQTKADELYHLVGQDLQKKYYSDTHFLKFRMSSRDPTRDSDGSISDSSHDDMLEDEQLHPTIANTLAETKRTREQGKS